MTTDKYTKVQALVDDGYSIAQAAKKVGISPAYFYALRSKARKLTAPASITKEILNSNLSNETKIHLLRTLN